MAHEHRVYAYDDGLFFCACGAVRRGDLTWMSDDESRRAAKRAARETQRLQRRHGTAVDAYGRRLTH